MKQSYRLTAAEGGGFRLSSSEGEEWDVRPAPGGWSVSSGPGGPEWKLKWEPGWAGGHVLEGPSPEGPVELGRTSRLTGEAGASADAFLLMGDGRVFRVRTLATRDPRVELTGWEVPGAYLTAGAEDGGWRIERTVAGSALTGAAHLLVLFAAEIARAAQS